MWWFKYGRRFGGQDTRTHHTRERGTCFHNDFLDSTAIQRAKDGIAEGIKLGRDFRRQTSIQRSGGGEEGKMEQRQQ